MKNPSVFSPNGTIWHEREHPIPSRTAIVPSSQFPIKTQNKTAYISVNMTVLALEEYTVDRLSNKSRAIVIEFTYSICVPNTSTWTKSPYCLPHSAATNHSSEEGISFKLPMSGKGLGPGGSGNDFELLDLILNHLTEKQMEKRKSDQITTESSIVQEVR